MHSTSPSPALSPRHQDRVAAYYQETTEASYLQWAGDALALHLGLSETDAPITDRAALDADLLRLNAWLARRAGITQNSRVLDAGCGVGGSSIWMARTLGAEVVGITLDPRQVALARGFALERGAARASFHAMDFAATTFAPGSFDVVWNLESLCHAVDPRAYLAHALTLLKPGGRLVCADFFRGSAGDPREAQAMCDGWVLGDLRSLDGIEKILRDEGFEAVEATDLTARVLPSADVMRAIGVREAFRLDLEALAGGPARPAYADHFRASAAAAEGLRSGSVTYGALCASRRAS